jgi:hypothetical protein
MQLDRRFVLRKVLGRWVWRCLLCQPEAQGSTAEFGRALVSLRHHFRVRYCHHAYVVRTYGRTL